jgi:hypothetical protein
MPTITVTPRNDGLFELRTSNGFPVGNRLISSAPEPGRKLPPEQTVFTDRIEASKAAADWIIYLAGVRKKKKRGK